MVYTESYDNMAYRMVCIIILVKTICHSVRHIIKNLTLTSPYNIMDFRLSQLGNKIYRHI